MIGVVPGTSFDGPVGTSYDDLIQASISKIMEKTSNMLVTSTRISGHKIEIESFIPPQGYDPIKCAEYKH
mgnify:CR=1 FL=1